MSSATVIAVTDAAAGALEAGAPQPTSVKDFTMKRDEGHVMPSLESLRGGGAGGGFGRVGSAMPFGYISSQGYSYVQDNWVRRGLSTTSGTVNWTDKLTATWVTTPSWSSPRHTITMRYFPSTGYFNSPAFDIDAYDGGTNAFIGSVASTTVALNGSSTTYTTYNKMYGKSLYHVANLYAKTRLGTQVIDGQTTARAGGYTDTTSACTY